MTLEEIALELEMLGLSLEQRGKMLSSIQRDGFDPKAIDKKLFNMGFEPVFVLYEDEEDQKNTSDNQ